MGISVDEQKKIFTLKKSEQAFNITKELMPRGVNSPLHAFKLVGRQPIIMDSVKASMGVKMGCLHSKMRDIDGNEYIDYVGSWGPAIIGHANDKVLAALVETMKKGTGFGARCLLENDLVEMVISAVPSIEAYIGVIRLARAFISREKIIKFEGCYHSHADPFLVKEGSGVATLGLPGLFDVPKGATYKTLTSPFNDISTVKNLFNMNTGEIAAVILEPVVGNSGFITPKLGFLEDFQKITKENDALLIFDEVMTRFRLSYGGAQEYFGITPDLTTLGKIISGGLQVGAYGERKEIMEMVAPTRPMYQADTLSGNPLTMIVGIHTLKRLKKPGSYEYLNMITSELIQGIGDVGKRAGHASCEGPVYEFEDAKKSHTAKFARFYRGMLEEGVYFVPSQFGAGFTSLAHTLEDVK
ncbi:hypothetical protein LOK49_LG04G02309 [Camellia lanceoleosa]|uniref:Uncharacterized protein n=1 Tax=Camellia lanceoleosa TaxID=1840588 RepID=A0ACC0HXQ4_9ERIC|nr:hypothetical protein LOK49_LG04G02309 [Camellia lanceoleosa]